MAPRLASIVVALTFTGIGALAVTRVLIATDSFWPQVLSVVYLAALLTLQLGYFSRPGVSLTPPVSYLALLGQACLVYLPLLQFGKIWLGLPGFLAGSVLLALPPKAAIPLFALIVASVATIDTSVGPIFESVPYTVLYAVVSTMVTALVVFGLSRLSRLIGKLDASRDELARLAVADERLRFARDLHDLLGLSLSAITLKSELAKRLMADDPARTSQEIDEILLMSRKALGDVRSVASGYRELSLDEECRSAKGVLTAADVRVSVERRATTLPAAVGTVLATVLREAVTNVLRHSKAKWCVITVCTDDEVVRMEVVNDGVSRAPDSARSEPGGGSGIDNLSHRVALLGGELEAHTGQDGRHLLRATIPLDAGEVDPASRAMGLRGGRTPVR
ncbi:sensor histidine kinase [Amycolatopsis marina]|nr:histidine kinase [Amycolatopsis marina]